MITLKVISDYSGFKTQKTAWPELLSRSRIDNIFLTYDWIDACIRHFYMDKKLVILNVFRGQELIGIAPLLIRDCVCLGFPARSVCFIGTGISDRMDFILEDEPLRKEEAMELILDYLMRIKKEWDFIDFQDMTEDAGTIKIIDAYLSRRKSMNIIGPSKRSFFIDLRDDRDSVFRKCSREFDRRIKKLNNQWIGSNFELERYINNHTDIEELFYKVSDVERRSWKGERGCGIFSKENIYNFHREIFDKFSKNRWLDVSILNLNKKPISYSYNYLYGERLYGYNMAYDRKYARLNPGMILMLWVFSGSISGDIMEIDYGRGDEEWKTRLSGTFRVHNRVRIFKGGFYSMCLYYLLSRIAPYMRKKRLFHATWIKIKDKLEWN